MVALNDLFVSFSSIGQYREENENTLKSRKSGKERITQKLLTRLDDWLFITDWFST